MTVYKIHLENHGCKRHRAITQFLLLGLGLAARQLSAVCYYMLWWQHSQKRHTVGIFRFFVLNLGVATRTYS